MPTAAKKSVLSALLYNSELKPGCPYLGYTTLCDRPNITLSAVIIIELYCQFDFILIFGAFHCVDEGRDNYSGHKYLRVVVKK